MSTTSAMILFLAANPTSSVPLALDEEVRSIEEVLHASALHGAFTLISKWATRTDDLLQHLNQLRPAIVHFSGHGSSNGGLMLHDEGQPALVSASALAQLFGVLRENIRVVYLNACHSQIQAEAIAKHVDCVIGTTGEISDVAARVFARSFYRALGFGESVAKAHEQGRVALLLHGIAETETPRLVVRSGVDAAQVFPLKAAAPTAASPSTTAARRSRVAMIAAPADVSWLEQLRTHLKPLARAAGIEVWDSSVIAAGADWRVAVEEGFAHASVVVVLVGPELLADDEFMDARLPSLVVGAEAASIRLLSLIVSASAFVSTALAPFKPLNDPEHPLDTATPSELNRRLLAAATQIISSAKS
jgi:hypothetical protein